MVYDHIIREINPTYGIRPLIYLGFRAIKEDGYKCINKNDKINNLYICHKNGCYNQETKEFDGCGYYFAYKTVNCWGEIDYYNINIAEFPFIPYTKGNMQDNQDRIKSDLIRLLDIVNKGYKLVITYNPNDFSNKFKLDKDIDYSKERVINIQFDKKEDYTNLDFNEFRNRLILKLSSKYPRVDIKKLNQDLDKILNLKKEEIEINLKGDSEKYFNTFFKSLKYGGWLNVSFMALNSLYGWSTFNRFVLGII